MERKTYQAHAQALSSPTLSKRAQRSLWITAVSLGMTLSTASAAMATEGPYRSIDGSDNNAIDSSMGQANTPLVRMADVAYNNGIDSMAGQNRPSARAVSTAMSSMPAGEFKGRPPSDFVWAWGQFLDHDISISEGAEPQENAPIAVPAGDPWFDPQNTGAVTLPFHRTVYDQSSGTDASNPRQQINQITAWIDASNVYGSDPVRAAALRRNDGSGKLKMSAGRLLPFNVDGLPNAGGRSASLFLAGDVRANEQLGLTAIHTVFVREHNRLATRISRRDNTLSGDEIYEQARQIVGAQMQYITYEEYLPALLGRRALSRYRGYKPWVDASIRNEFSTALYRYGHSAIGHKLLRLNRQRKETRFGHLSLADAFFSPQRLITEGGVAPVLRGFAHQACQPIDLNVTDELRNFLFGPPGAGGLDLAALNIQRGRDHGIADYNSVRAAYGLSPAASFSDISSKQDVQDMLASLYGSVNDIDAWVGALAEDTHAGMVGELIHTALKEQFEALRDGDRFWYQQHMSGWDMRQVDGLSTIIKRNTSIGSELPDNVFKVPRRGR